MTQEQEYEFSNLVGEHRAKPLADIDGIHLSFEELKEFVEHLCQEAYTRGLHNGLGI